MFVVDVNHSFFSMQFAVRRQLAARDIKGGSRCAVALMATPVADVDHAVLRMLPAVLRHLAARKIEGRSSSASGT